MHQELDAIRTWTPVVHFQSLCPDAGRPILGKPTVLIQIGGIEVSPNKRITVLKFNSERDLKDAMQVVRGRVGILAINRIKDEDEFFLITGYLQPDIILSGVPMPVEGYNIPLFKKFLEKFFRVKPEELKMPSGVSVWVKRNKAADESLLSNAVRETLDTITILSYLQSTQYDLTIKDGMLHFSTNPAFKLIAERWNFDDFVRRWQHQSVMLLKQSRDTASFLLNFPVIRVSPEVERLLNEAMTTASVPLAKAPFLDLPEEMRFGILDYYSVVTDKELSRTINVYVSTRTERESGYALKLKDDGSVETRSVERTKKIMTVSVGSCNYREHDFNRFLEHYSLPKVPDVASVAADKYELAKSVIEEFEATLLKPHGQSLRRFQKEDLARLLVKGYGIYAADPGLGKTIAGWIFALTAIQFHKTNARVLIVAPQDLIPHWISEAAKFFGKDFVSDLFIIRNVQDAIELTQFAKRLPPTAPIIAITYYEALRHSLPEDYNRKHGLAEGLDGDNHRERLLSRKERCPMCGRRPPSSKDGTWCWSDCPDPTPWAFRARDAAFYLKEFVKRGVLIVDEATLAKSADSLRGVATRRLVTAKCRLLLTGTPIKNMLSDLPTLLQLAARPQSPAYPFPAESAGITRFSKRFLVIERDLETGKTKVVPEATDLQRLHFLLSGIILRRTKDQIDEEIAPLEIKVHQVPMTPSQIEWYRTWVDDAVFSYWYAMVKEKPPSMLEKMLSLLSRLIFVVYHPTSKTAIGDPFPLNNIRSYLPTPSELTFRNKLVAELVAEAVRKDGSCVLYAQTVGVFKFFERVFSDYGIKVHSTLRITRNGDVRSVPPGERAVVIRKFENEGGVLFASISAMAYGHDMPFCSHCVIHSLPLAYDQFIQAINRIHRLTSPKPVTANVIITPKSVDHYLFDLLSRKHTTSKQLLHSTIDDFRTITAQELARIAQQAVESVEEVMVQEVSEYAEEVLS